MAWQLTRGMANLRRQVDARWPNRDRTSDGAIGDAAHAAGTSGHNPDDSPYDNAEWNGDPDSTPEVRAIDLDSDLRESGTSAQELVDHLRGLSGVSSVIRYLIFSHRIYRASNGFRPETYAGPSPHTEHIHVSGAYSQASDNNDSFDFKLEEVGNVAVELSAASVEAVATAVAAKVVSATASATWGAGFGPVGSRETAGERLAHVDAAVDEINAKLDTLTAPEPPVG